MTDSTSRATTLAFEHVSVRFGGLAALSDVTFEVAEREIVGLIGPNGAGKTTAFNVACGFQRPTSGSVSFPELQRRSLHPAQLAKAGVARTLQGVGLFNHMSVLENVMAGAQSRPGGGVWSSLLGIPSERRHEREIREDAMAQLERLGVARYAGSLPSGIPYGIAKKVSIARALMRQAAAKKTQKAKGVEQMVEQTSVEQMVEQTSVEQTSVEEMVEQMVRQAEEKATPKDTAQRNFTDPDSRVMKTSDGSFHFCYNAQTVVDDAHQVIVATRLDNHGADSPAFADMLDQVTRNCGASPVQVLADAGYFSEDNVKAAESRGIDSLIATGRLRHSETPPKAPRGPIPKDATPKQRMARKLRTTAGRAAYARRKAIVEPVFGQMDVVQNAKHLLLRGENAAAAEWELLSACHNLRKLFGVKGTAKFALT